MSERYPLESLRERLAYETRWKEMHAPAAPDVDPSGRPGGEAGDSNPQVLARVSDLEKELTGGSFCDRVIEAVGKQWPLDLAGEITRERGRLIIAGYHQDGPRQVNMWLWNWRGLDVINAHERDPKIYMQGRNRAPAGSAFTSFPGGEFH